MKNKIENLVLYVTNQLTEDYHLEDSVRQDHNHYNVVESYSRLLELMSSKLTDEELDYIINGDKLQNIEIKKQPRYTDFVDKNGTKIYEGDSLGHKDNIVEFSFGCWNINGDRPLYMMAKHHVVVKIK